MADDLSGARVVVTGCARGIGAAVAIQAAKSGADVAGLDMRDARETREAVEATGQRAFIAEIDAADSAAVSDFAAEASGILGGIDKWVNNAGILLARPFLEVTTEEWDRVLAVNLRGYVNGCRAAVEHMLPSGRGAIVNVSSVTDVQPVANLSPYIAAKGAIVALSKALALEYGDRGVRVNAVAPGAVDTELNAAVYTKEVRQNYNARIPLRRIATAAEIADTVIFLLSERSRYITGIELLADGGLVLNGNVGHRVR